MMNNDFVHEYIARNELTLLNIIHETSIPAPILKQAMIYHLFPGGKRLRAILVYLCGELVEAKLEALDMIAAAIELIHGYSLIHDDLPSMDNDDVRRGQPSCHRKFDEATAILVGDGMQSLASELLLTQLPTLLTSSVAIQIALELLKASGLSGMVSGQSLDLTELKKPNLTKEQLEQIHSLKTGALFEACITMPLLAGKTNPMIADALKEFSKYFGLLFQMQDDYHDRYSDPTVLGKNRSSDEANQKITFAQLFDQKTLLDLIEQYYKKTIDSLRPLGKDAGKLLTLIEFLHQGLAPRSL